MKNYDQPLRRRALALFVSLAMCTGMLSTTALAVDGTTTKTETETSSNTTQTGDEANGSSTTTTTVITETTTTTVETSTDTKTEVNKGEFQQTAGKPSVETKTDGETPVSKDEIKLDYSAGGKTHLDLSSGAGSSGTLTSGSVTAGEIASESGLTCKDQGPVTDSDGKTTETKVDDTNGSYKVTTSTSEIIEKTEGSVQETGNKTTLPGEVTETKKEETPGQWQQLPSSGSESDILLPTRPEGGTTSRDDGTQQVVSVSDIVENGQTVGYTVTTQELDAQGNVISTKTEEQRGTKTVVTNAEEKKDTLVESTTTETTTTVEGVKKDTVVKETVTKTTEVNVSNDKLSANVNIRVNDGKQTDNLLQATSADVSIKQTVKDGESSFTTDLDFTVKVDPKFDGTSYRLEVYQGDKLVSEQDVKVYANDGNISLKGIVLKTDSGVAKVNIKLTTTEDQYNCTKHPEYSSLNMKLDVEFKNIKGVEASAVKTEAARKETETTTTNYTREDVETKTETTTTVTTTQVTKITDTDTVNRDWSTTTPTPGGTTPGGTTPGGTTPGGTTPGGTTPGGTTIGDGEVPLAGNPGETTIGDGEVPLANLPEETTLPEEEVPLSELPEETTIPDEDVPLADVPKTGDISAIWYALTILAAGGLLTLRVFDRKKQEGLEI